MDLQQPLTPAGTTLIRTLSFKLLDVSLEKISLKRRKNPSNRHWWFLHPPQDPHRVGGWWGWGQCWLYLGFDPGFQSFALAHWCLPSYPNWQQLFNFAFICLYHPPVYRWLVVALSNGNQPAFKVIMHVFGPSPSPILSKRKIIENETNIQ